MKARVKKMRIKVTCEVSECSDTAKGRILVHNHWNRKDLVEIEVDGKRYTVDGESMKTAIDNCMNVGR